MTEPLPTSRASVSAQTLPASPATRTFTPFVREAVEQTITARFEEQAHRFPERVAVAAAGTTVTYAGLNADANRIARAILAHCGTGEEPIAVCLGKDATALAGLLGALKAGKLYVMLDPSYAPQRLAAIVTDTRAPLIITDHRYRTLADGLVTSGCAVLDLDALDPHLQTEDLPSAAGPERPALISYTSGSSGKPKGLVETHRNVLYHIMAFTNALRICPADRLSLLHSLSVRAAEMQIFGALLNGATLCPFEVNVAGVAALGRWLREERVTILHALPAIFRELVALPGAEQSWPGLRVVHLSSAPVTRRDVELYRSHFGPDCVFLHRLGSTEAQTIRWLILDHETPFVGNTVPLGYQVADTEILICDEDGCPEPPGTLGEIVIKSHYLAPGYWNQPELTQRVFLAAPDGSGARLCRTGDLGRLSADGCLELIGRKDFQVKIRGKKVNPGEIEVALLGTPGVRDAAVVVREDAIGDGVVVAYVVFEPGQGLTVSALREQLAGDSVPTKFMVVDALPHTANGKIDRRALLAPDSRRPHLDVTLVVPRTPIETVLAQVWQEVLGLEAIGVHDSFLDLGGDSFTAMRIVNAVRERLHLDLPTAVLLEAPTVAEMALVALCHGATGLPPGEIERLLKETAG
jgi:amino acid adenylation domain-containing protein